MTLTTLETKKQHAKELGIELCGERPTPDIITGGSRKSSGNHPLEQTDL
jgi:hypothetical protein